MKNGFLLLAALFFCLDADAQTPRQTTVTTVPRTQAATTARPPFLMRRQTSSNAVEMARPRGAAAQVLRSGVQLQMPRATPGPSGTTPYTGGRPLCDGGDCEARTGKWGLRPGIDDSNPATNGYTCAPTGESEGQMTGRVWMCAGSADWGEATPGNLSDDFCQKRWVCAAQAGEDEASWNDLEAELEDKCANDEDVHREPPPGVACGPIAEGEPCVPLATGVPTPFCEDCPAQRPCTDGLICAVSTNSPIGGRCEQPPSAPEADALPAEDGTTCSPIPGCGGQFYCDASFRCRPKLINGQSCLTNEMCISGNCVDVNPDPFWTNLQCRRRD